MQTLITPQEFSSEKRWWSAMGYPGGAPELIVRHDLERVFHETYKQPSTAFFSQHPGYAFDPTLFGELTDRMKDRPRTLPLLGPPVSRALQEAGWALWREQAVPGPLEYFVQHGLYEELQEALGGWEPQAVLEIFPEHVDGVVLSSILWWHHAMRGSDLVIPAKAEALRALSPLVHQYEIESALEAQQVKAKLS